MKRFALNLIYVTLPMLALIALVLEFSFRAIIPASNAPLAHFDNTHSILKFDQSRTNGLFTIGSLAQQKAHWRINNEGWNSEIDYFEEKKHGRIAVIGDSYIEAFQVDYDKKYPALLRTKFDNEADIYSFGISGAPLSQYLHMSRYVTEMFDPDTIIINLVHNDFLESIYSKNPENIHFLRLSIDGETVDEVKPEPNYSFKEFSRFKLALNDSALIRYLNLNLRLKSLLKNIFEGNTTYAANTNVGSLTESRKEIETATRYVLNRLSLENPNRRIIIVMDADRNAIYGGTENPEIQYLHQITKRYCVKFGLDLIDLSEAMSKSYRLNRKKFNSEFDSHWDEYGHDFVYQQVAEIL